MTYYKLGCVAGGSRRIEREIIRIIEKKITGRIYIEPSDTCCIVSTGMCLERLLNRSGGNLYPMEETQRIYSIQMTS